MGDDLTKVKGIGPSAAKKYVAAGFETIESIAAADADAIAKVPGVGQSRAEGVIAAAKELTGETANAAPPTEEPQSEPKAARTVSGPIVKSDRGSLLGNPTIAIPLGIAIVIAVIAYTKTDDEASSSAAPSPAAMTDGSSTAAGFSRNASGMQGAVMPAPVPMPAPMPANGYPNGAPAATEGSIPAANQPQPANPYYAPYPYGAYNGWNNNGYGNGYGNAYGNSGMAMDMNSNARAKANSTVAGQGYGYHNPYYYGSPYAYGPYGYPYPVMNPPVVGTQN